MKKLVVALSRQSSIPTPIGLIIVAILAVTFWFSSTPALAQDPEPCTICHKRFTTLSLPCGSLQYQRHLDHGDKIGRCEVTPTQNP